MNRIMFVDDDQNILQGIRRMLRPMRQEWHMTFSSSGKEALDILQTELYDAVISDTRMPGMNGIELLNEIKELYPNMVRIGLSGYTDENLALLSTRTTHQQLSKPCDADELKDTINKAITLRTRVTNNALNQIITNTASLPSLPRLYQEITDIMQSDDGSLKKVAEVIAKDIAITAKILQLVNSAFFGLARHVGSSEEAVMYLGYDVIRGLLLTIELFYKFEHADASVLDLEQLWNRSFAISGISKHLAKAAGLDSKLQDYAQMAGMLHDIGILIMAANMPDEYSKVTKIKLKTKQNTCIVEEKIFGCTHAEVGGALLGLWGLPDPIFEAVSYHHCPSRAPDQSLSPLTIVHLACLMYWQNTDPDLLIPIDSDYTDKLGMQEQITRWQEDVCTTFFKDKIN